MDFSEIVMKRFAAKSFNEKLVQKKSLEKLLEIIRFAPSSFNLQPWRIKIVEDRQVLEKLQEASWNQPQVGSCSHLLVFCSTYDCLPRVDRLEKLMLEGGVEKEKVAFFCGMTRGFVKNFTKEQALAWSQRQTYIALANALNGSKSLGFDSCPLEGIDTRAYGEILKISEPWSVTVACAIGFTDEVQPEKLRYTKEEIFF